MQVDSKYLKEIIKKVLGVPVDFIIYVYSIYRPIKLVYYRTNRLGHLAMNTEFFLRQFQVDDSMNRYTYILIPDNFISNRVLYDMYKNYFKRTDNIILIENKVFVFVFTIMRKVVNNKYYFDIEMKSNEYNLFTETKSTISFERYDIDRGYQILKKMGIDNWYVCIFARDSAYLKTIIHTFRKNIDLSYHNFRDSDIDDFELAIRYIIERGGYVVRFGRVVEKKISFQHKNLIDYPFTEYISDFMDIFLISQCKFILGGTSGAVDVCSVFDIPQAGVNWVPIDQLPLTHKKDMGIVKKLKKDGQYISLSRYNRLIKNNKNLLHDGNSYQEYGITIEDNSKEEILDVSIEMLQNLEDKLELSEDDIKNQKKYQEIHNQSLYYSSIKTPISYAFLRKNRWFINNEL